jgi:hypothetical protein
LRLKLNNTLALLAPAAMVVAGCGGRVSASGVGAPSGLSIQAAAARIDTNRTTRYTATLADGQPASVEWSVSGGDPSAGPGSISREGVYTPPSYLTEKPAKSSPCRRRLRSPSFPDFFSPLLQEIWPSALTAR